MFSLLGWFDPVHPWVFWGVVAMATSLAFLSVRKARGVRSAIARLSLHAAAGLAGVVVVVLLILSHHVREDQLGIGKAVVLQPGVHVWPKEAVVRISRAGAFTIPYPNERLYLLVEYRVANPELLLPLFEELRSINGGLRRDFFRESVVGEESWRGVEDSLVLFLQKHLRARLPSNPTAPGHLEYSLEPILGIMRDFGIRGEIFLVRKDLLKSS
jgi:hypothetical protein